MKNESPLAIIARFVKKDGLSQVLTGQANLKPGECAIFQRSGEIALCTQEAFPTVFLQLFQDHSLEIACAVERILYGLLILTDPQNPIGLKPGAGVQAIDAIHKGNDSKEKISYGVIFGHTAEQAWKLLRELQLARLRSN